MWAGSTPAAVVNAVAVQAMAEPATDEVVNAADVVISMGCGDACPVYPGKLYLDWDVDDPAGQPIEKVRLTGDEIRRRAEKLLTELGVLAASVAPLKCEVGSLRTVRWQESIGEARAPFLSRNNADFRS
jgi:hypothetical protein